MAIVERIIPLSSGPKHPPTFLVGPPRSGTTLTRLLISEGMRTSYFSELTTEALQCGGRPAPLVSSFLTRAIGWKNFSHDRFVNSYGRSTGRTAPIEGEPIWHYLFGTKYDAVDPENVSPMQTQHIKHLIRMTEFAFGGLPFVDKTTALSVRIRALAKVFPNASFIHVTRDYLDTAQSILVARNTKFPEWIGPRPRECLIAEGDSLVQQVCKQVHYTEANIARERAEVGDERFLTVAYTDVCGNPQATLERIVEFLRSRGVPAQISEPATEPFKLSTGRKIDEEDYAALKMELAALKQK